MESTATTGGRQRPTLASVAARAGVSASTASIAFSGSGPVSEATRARVLAAAAELDYAGPDPVARSLRRGRSGVIAVVTEDRLADAFRDPMNLAVLDGIGEAFGDQHLGLLVIPLIRDESRALLDTAMDAAILLGCGTDVSTSVEQLLRRRIPVVGIETAPMVGVVTIGLDNRDASRRGAELLAELGHRRVAVITLPLDRARSRGAVTADAERDSRAFVATERLGGVREVFAHAVAVAAAGSTVAEGAIAARALLAQPDAERPTAIVAQSDLLAAGVLLAAEELGVRVPEQLSVVGFDGVRLEGTTTQLLTTLVQPAVEKGRAAGDAVLAALAGTGYDSWTLHSQLRSGATTAPPHA